jgi:hypothetical protein
MQPKNVKNIYGYIDENAYRAVNYKWIVESGENFSFTELPHAYSLKKGEQNLWQF